MSDASEPAPLPVICLVRDLLFYSKIRAAAEAAGVLLKSVRQHQSLADERGAMLIVDLNQDGCLESAADWRRRTGKPVIGFVSHVDVETIAAARAGGIDQVLARSQFEKNLAAILRSMGVPPMS